METGQPVLAIDVGGTKVALAVVDAQGTILDDEVVPTATSSDGDAIWAPIGAGLAALLKRSGDDVTEVGVGSAGPIDAPSGTVSPVNIGGWREYPLVRQITAAVSGATGSDPRVLLAGDGHCIALGEHWLGAGRDFDTMVGMVISTGIGGGAVIKNRLFAGTTGNAVHIGHTSVNAWGARCVCGSHGCVEMYARGPALVEAARAKGWQGADGKELTQAAAAGDTVAIEVIDNGMRAAAAGIAATATYLDIDQFVIGGGLSKAGAVIFDPLRRHLRDFAVLPYVVDLQIHPAELENAGLLGAASLALSLTGRGPLEPDELIGLTDAERP
ncbi:MAG: ROK family protein [Propionibacteriales bacterium]|nr:ROK family protein [Propionibacteriales bacterium]